MATSLDESSSRRLGASARDSTPQIRSRQPGFWSGPYQLAAASAEPSRQASRIRKTLEKAVDHHRSGHLSDAVRLYQEVLRRDPNSADAWHLVGVIAVAHRKHEQAAEHVSRALQLCPNEAEYHATMAQIQAEISNWELAHTHARSALALNAACPAALHAMGLVLCWRGQIESACRHFRDAAVGEPSVGRVWLDYGDCLNQLELYEESLEALQKAMELMPDSPLPPNSLGRFWSNQGDLELALRCFNEALRLDPDLATAHNSVADQHRQLGRIDDAIPHYRKLLELDEFVPSTLHSLSELASAGEYDFTDDELDRIEGLCLSPDMSDTDLSLLHFARARVLEREELYDDAFEDFALANQYRLNLVRRAGTQFRHTELESWIDTLIETFTPDLFEQARSRGIGSDSDVPVFVVGMPRSGIRLTEQILASHPNIVGAGSLTDIDRLAWRMLSASDRRSASPDDQFPQWLQTPDPELLGIAADAYLGHIKGMAPDAEKIVDRTPGNFFYLGFVALLFPDAHIIHSRRDPLDTCIGCFTHSFSEPTIASASATLENLAFYYHQYDRLMNHWCSVLPASMLEVCYEDLTTDPEEQCRRALAHIDLPWDAACVSFHSNPAAAGTDDASQLFKPIHTNSVNRWKNYEPHLTPLLDAMMVCH